MTRSVRFRAAGTVLAVLAATVVTAVTVTTPPPAAADVVKNAKDDLRTGWYPDQPTLTRSLVTGGTFGQQFSANVDGQVYAQPLVANGTLLVATENNNIYGLDPATGAQKWTKNLGVAWKAADIGCADLAPTVGVTSTPVVDPASNTMYLTSKTYASGASGPAAYYLHALDVATGAERSGFPVTIAGKADNDATHTFSPTTQLQRPGLLLMNGVIYAGFGGHCDHSPYQGWVVGVSTAGKITAMWNDQAGTGDGGGIWQSGAGLVSDGPGQIIFSSGNGNVPLTATAGKAKTPAALAQSVGRLSVQADGTLKATDFFAPYDALTLNTWDADVGSGGPMALPDSFGAGSHPHLLVQVGKQGYVYLIDRDNLGGMGQGSFGGDAVVQRLGPDGGLWGKPAAWPGDGGYVYIATASAGNSTAGTAGALHAYKAGVNGSGDPTLSLVGTSSDAFGLSSSPPIVTSDGTTSGSALVWIIYAPSGDGTGAQLRVYDPTPSGGKLTLLNSWPIGTSSKFNSPAVDNGHVYVGARDGHVLGFGSPQTTPLLGSSVSFGPVAIGRSAVKTATLKAQSAVTVTALSAGGKDYTAGTPTPALPARLAAGDTLSVPVTFTPTTVGLHGANLVASTSAGPVNVALDGTGLSATAQINASPPVVSFGGVAIGSSATESATFSNSGAQPLTINAVTVPKAPFTVSGLPAPGYVLGAGASFTVTTTFAPTASGSFTDEIDLDTTGGDIELPLSGSASTPPQLKLTPQDVDFGSPPVGGTVTKTFIVSNPGGSPLAITKSKPPITTAGFAATSTLPEGSTIPAGGSVTETVTFTPSRTGPASDGWIITGNDGSGAQTVTLRGTGVPAVIVPSPTATNGWTKNGSTVLPSGGGAQLTDVTSFYTAGSSWWPTAVGSGYLDASFDAYQGGGVGGADGLTFALAPPATGANKGAKAVGGSGGGLGWSGVPGIAVALDTSKNGADPSANFVGVATGGVSGKPDQLVWKATSTTVPALRGTTRKVNVHLENGVLTVGVDGVRVLTTTVTLGTSVLVGFTAGTGVMSDKHLVSNVKITALPAP